MDTATRPWRPSYLRLARSGELEERSRRLDEMLSNCTLCPRTCGIDRRTELGECATGPEAVVASWNPHHGEEPVLSCRRGSGTIFLANCNLKCAFCQNHDISQRPRGQRDHVLSDEEVAGIFLDLQDRGCHNLNWVSPTHQVPQLVRALLLAAHRGFALPIVYNTNGYDAIETLRLLDGIVDIYMPDLKYASPEAGCRLSAVQDYPAIARAALSEMYGQIGDTWDLGPEGELRRGILVRMLVLPNGLSGVEQNLAWISSHLSPRLTISLLAQYHPAHRVPKSPAFADLDRGVTRDEWRAAEAALEAHMEGDRHHVQGLLI